ncbi:MAG TPA: TolC family protein [Chthoniobacteraceae bacterium]|jgi:cobalt-zinc-cadmium efflux system outer membrane protein
MKSIFLLLILASSAWAGEVRLRLDETPGYALQHNPQLAAARLRIDEARGRLLGAGRLTKPELDVDFSQNVRMPERAVGIGFMQRFPLTARLRLEKAMSRAQLLAAEAEVRDAERKLTAEVRTAAVKLLAVRAQRDLREQQLTNSREQTKFITERVATGEAAAVDASMTELETQQLAVELLQLETSRAALLGELRPLLGVAASDGVEITGPLAAPGAVPARGATGEGRADLEAARHTAEAARQSTSLARAQQWQDFGAGITASGERMEDAPEGISNDYFLGFKLSVPLPFWNKNEGGIAEAAAAATRAEKEIDALALNIGAEAEAARAEMAALAKLVAAMDSGLLPKATQVEEQLRTSYGTGQTPLTEVLRARSRRLELSQRRVDALRDYHLARVRYDAAIGRTFSTGGRAGK